MKFGGRVVIAAAALIPALVPATAAAQFPGLDLQRLSVAADGGVPNGASRIPAISQDKRWGRFAAYESDATNIVAGSGAFTNVYVVERQGPYGENGTAWRAGRTILASRGRGGEPANGPSTNPVLSGTSRVAPRCVAFVSAASNLVRGDTNGKPDAFVYDLATGVTRRVSVNSRGRQSNGTVTEVAVNGLCTRVAFVSDGGDVGLTKTRNRSWRSAVTRPSPAGRRQVYLRALRGTTGIDKALKGLTFLASANGRASGNADSYGISYSNNARALTFASDASNLSGIDRNGQTDVYQRTMDRSYGRKVKHRRVQKLAMNTIQVSATQGGEAGNGASHSPASNTTGAIVAFATNATNLTGNSSSDQQVVQAEVGAGSIRTRLASHNASGGAGNGPSARPSLTAGGTWVIFESAASDIAHTTNRRPDTNGGQDAILWTQASGDRWLLGEHGDAGPTSNADTSPHGNYVVFERGGQVHLLYVGAR